MTKPDMNDQLAHAKILPLLIRLALPTTIAQLIQLTSTGMRIMFCTSLFIGMQRVNQNAFVALGNTRYSFLFGIMRKLLFLLPLALILPLMFGIWGIYMAEAVSNLLTTVITYIFLAVT